MQSHVHTGFVSFLFAGVSAVLFINLRRLAAAKLAEKESTANIGRTVGALVTFSGRE